MNYDQYKHKFQKSIDEDGLTVVKIEKQEIKNFIAWAEQFFWVEHVQNPPEGSSLPCAVYLKSPELMPATHKNGIELHEHVHDKKTSNGSNG